MKWLDRVRAKNAEPTPQPLTKLTKGDCVSPERAFVSFVSALPQDAEFFEQRRGVNSGGLASPVRAIIRIAYQAIWFDYDLPDGEYTPEQLCRARKVVKRGAVRHYTLTFPAASEGSCAHAAPETDARR